MLVDWLICTWFVHISLIMLSQFCRLVADKRTVVGTETWLRLYRLKKRKEKRNNFNLTRRQWFKSVTSTGYKWYFLSILTNVKPLCEEKKKKKPTWTSHLFGLMWVRLTVARFESFFSWHILFIYAKTRDEWTLCLSSSAA